MYYKQSELVFENVLQKFLVTKTTQFNSGKTIYLNFSTFNNVFLIISCVYWLGLFFRCNIVPVWLKTTEPAAGSNSIPIMFGWSEPSRSLPSYHYVDSMTNFPILYSSIILWAISTTLEFRPARPKKKTLQPHFYFMETIGEGNHFASAIAIFDTISVS